MSAKLTRQQLEQFARDPSSYRAALQIKTGSGPRRFGDIIADFQRKDFAAIDAALRALRAGRAPNPKRLWIERTKGASKDSDLASAILWLLAFAPRPLLCQVGAADREQADELRKACRDFLELNPWLAAQGIEIRANSIVNGRGGQCDILSSDEGGSHGARPDLIVINELTHHTSRGFCDTLLGNATKIPNCVVIVVTNAGETGSWQERLRNTAMRPGSRWYFSKYDQPAPWIDPQDVAEQEVTMQPNWVARYWRGQWVGKSCAALSDEDVKAAMIPGEPLAGPINGFQFFAGLDLGFQRDATGFVVIAKHVGWMERKPIDRPPPTLAMRLARAKGEIVDELPEYDETWHAGDGRLSLVGAWAWTPERGRPVSPEAVEKGVLEVAGRYPLAWLYSDPHQFLAMEERFRKAGLLCGRCDFVPSNLKDMAQLTINAFRDRMIDLPQAAPGVGTLAVDVGTMQAAERSYGFRLVAPKKAAEGGTHHGDLGTALQLAILASARMSFAGGMPGRINRPLVCYP